METNTTHEADLRAPALRKRAKETGYEGVKPGTRRRLGLTPTGGVLPRQVAAKKVLRIAVVIPCFNVAKHIVQVVDSIGPEVAHIVVVDDCCPQKTHEVVRARCTDGRLTVVRMAQNGGVGAATLRGYREAIALGADIILKLDGDGQMDPKLIGRFVRPVALGLADYTKGNRFFHLEHLQGMPAVRQFGNAMLSLMTKFSSGYWDVVDPTNGFTCIHAKVAKQLPLHKISGRYFFESDILFRLGLMGAVVADVPMASVYGDEVSGLKIRRIVGEFSYGHIKNFGKRLVYKYLLREVNVGTLELMAGLMLSTFGALFGGVAWYRSISEAHVATSGTVMLAGMSVILGVQLLLSGVHFDIQSVPKKPLHPRL